MSESIQAGAVFAKVEQYAKAHNISVAEAIQKIGLTLEETKVLAEFFAGQPEAPVDGFQRKPDKTFILKSGRKVEVYMDSNGEKTFKYRASDGTPLNETYFLKEEGLSGRHFAMNSKGDLVTVKDTDAASSSESGFFAKAWDKIKKDVSGYAQNFTNAWNNSEGALGTTGALIGAATKTATDVVKNQANNIEKGVEELTGSKIAGQVASYATGAGLAADAVEAVEKFGDWSSDKIRAAAQNYTGTERELLLGFADFVDDMNAADIALMFAGGVGAAKYAKDLPKILNLLQKAAVPAAGVAVLGTMASCSPEENISQEVNLLINQNSSLEEAIDALLQGQLVTNQILAAILEREIANGTTINDIKELVSGNSYILTQLVDAMSQNNTLLTDIRNNMQAGDEAVLEAIISLQNSVDVLSSLVAEQPEYSGQLSAIIDAIETGNKSLSELKSMVDNLFVQLKNNGQIQGDILAKLEEIQNSGKSDSEKLTAMLELLANINSKLDIIIGKLVQEFENDQAVKNALNTIIALVDAGNAKSDITNQMLEKLLTMMENGVSKDDIKAIIEAISKNGDKIDDVNFFLNKIQNQNQEFQQKVLDMVAKYGVDVFKLLETDQGSDAKLDAIAQLLAKIQNQDEKFQQNVLNILKNINVSGGADYTEILNKILEATQGNGEKLDAVAQLLAKIQDQDEKFQQNILNVINDLGTNSTTVLNDILASIGNNGEKLDAIAQLLAKIDSNVEKYGEEGKALGNEILNAIKTLGADISGKLTQILNVANSGSDTGKAVMELLNKVLEKLDSMDSNRKAEAEAIIDAIANIKIEGGGNGNVDLSSVEKMLSELLDLTAKNNGLLESIDGKMDVINVTIETAKNEILAKMDKNDANTTAILNALNEFKNISNANDKAILEKMDTIINILNNIKDNKYDDTNLMAKLDDILAAIKDHKVTVDVTGKVTCECNCGGNHEGILGDLEQVLG